MVLNRNNTRTFHRTLYATELQSIRLLKRDDDQKQGTVTAYTLYECRRGIRSHTGEPIAGSMAAMDVVTWHIPKIELDRVGVQYINALDRIEDLVENTTWQPEADTQIDIKLFGNMVRVQCKRFR